jgi:hypothetical protein
VLPFWADVLGLRWVMEGVVFEVVVWGRSNAALLVEDDACVEQSATSAQLYT